MGAFDAATGVAIALGVACHALACMLRPDWSQRMSGELIVILVVGGLPLVAGAVMLYFADRDARRRAGR